jgi:hypothetical protein
LPGIPGDFHGRPTRRLESGHCWIEVLVGGGPRIVRLGLPGRENILAESPDVGWDAGYGRFELLGGHRLWFAPETPECSVPDSAGLELVAAPSGALLIGAVQEPTGLRKEMDIWLDPQSAAVSVRHTFRNEGVRTLELSPWPITQLRLGGVAVVPQPAAVTEHAMKPNRLLVIWPYASWLDDRLSLGEKGLTVAGRSGSQFKIGCLSAAGTIAYLREGLLFVKRFDPAVDAPHADLGTNVQIYCDAGSIELETLGPLVRLAPGDSTSHDEHWELREVGDSAGMDEVASLLA